LTEVYRDGLPCNRETQARVPTRGRGRREKTRLLRGYRLRAPGTGSPLGPAGNFRTAGRGCPEYGRRQASPVPRIQGYRTISLERFLSASWTEIFVLSCNYTIVENQLHLALSLLARLLRDPTRFSGVPRAIGPYMEGGNILLRPAAFKSAGAGFEPLCAHAIESS
jgi:hypothetical protein